MAWRCRLLIARQTYRVHPTHWLISTQAGTASAFGNGGPLSEDNVVCPGNDPSDYCNCKEEDCENEDGRDLCLCEEARSCCGQVLCPGLDPEEYCDCEKEGDCADPRTEGMCGCAEAIACCSD